ncbi:MAG: MMPL family transporter [Flavobacteriaceae bacterium]
MHRFFYGIYKRITRQRWFSLLVLVFLFVSFLFFAFQIEFEEDISRVLPKNEQTDITSKVLQQMDFSDKIAVIIQKEKDGTFEDLTQTANRFLDSIGSLNHYIEKVQGRLQTDDFNQTLDFFYDNIPLFLSPEDYQTIEARLQKDSIKKLVENNYKTLISPTGIISKNQLLKDPFGLTFLGLEKLQSLQADEDLSFENGFLTTPDRSKILLFIKPTLSGSETKQNTAFVHALDEIKMGLNTEFKDRVSVDYFGANFVAVANATQIKQDILTTITVSISLLMLLLIFYYRTVFIPFIVFIPTVFGAVTALAFVYFFLGKVSAISISIGAILLGVTIDYSLHILTHFKHHLDVKSLYNQITKPVIISSATTAAAFLCLLFVESDVLKDLGVFAAVSVLASAFFALVLIPHLYRPSAKIKTRKPHIFDRFASVDFHRNKVLVFLTLAVVVVSLFVFGKLQFNSNISDLNFVSEELKAAEAKLEESTNLTSKSIYVTVYGATEEEVLVKNDAVFSVLQQTKEENGLVKMSSIASVLFSEEKQQERINRWREFWNPERVDFLKQTMVESGKEFGFKPEAYNNFYAHLESNFSQKQIDDFEAIPSIPVSEFVSESNGFYTVSTLVKVDEDQRGQLVSKFQNFEGVLLIDRQEINETFLGQLKDDFGSLINYSLLVIFLILWLFFRRVELVLVAIIPIVITAIVTVGVLVLLQIELNIFSLIVCTLIFGIGVDFSIFMTSALQKKYTGFTTDLRTYKASILLAVLTTTLAMGALIFAKHPALKSISVASIVGVFSALIVTFVFYPILFKFFFENRVKKGKSPVSMRLLVHSFFSFTYYGLGGLFIAVLGPLFMFLVPVKRETKMLWFRKVISVYLKSVLYTNPFVVKKVLNAHHETFEKPSVIISNHTSFLDSIAIGMLSPKIIFLVNDWVYNSVIIGGAARLAGFYPVSKGIDDGISHLRKKVDEGYSLMVFPEATRSKDNVIKRFHKGAFYLANEFQLDILPIYIHGNADVCPKGDHIIYDGKITVIVDQRIPHSQNQFGSNISKYTKAISANFKKSFSKIRFEQEDENYYRKTILLSFLYKEPSVSKAVKGDFDSYKHIYYLLWKELGEKETVFRLANDYGQWDALLALQQPNRKIISYIDDTEKRNVASANYIVQKRMVNYIETPLQDNLNWDTLLISELTIETEVLNKLLAKTKSVILLHNFALKTHLESLSFQQVYEGEYMIFKKIERE